MSTSTRDRILDEAMRLFSEHGVAGTSIARIEKEAGLTPGSGGLYHHFASKDAVLAAGVKRHLDRIQALRDIRSVLTPLGDLHAELTLTARYVLAELDQEAELLRILAAGVRDRPETLSAAVQDLVGSTFQDFASWVRESAERRLTVADAHGIAAVGLGSLFGSRLMQHVLSVPLDVGDDVLVATWVQMMGAAMQARAPS